MNWHSGTLDYWIERDGEQFARSLVDLTLQQAQERLNTADRNRGPLDKIVNAIYTPAPIRLLPE